jgi:tetratricopeptide (TPR) repeat protein
MGIATYRKWQEYLETGLKYLAGGNTLKAEEFFCLSLTEAEVLGVPVIIAFSARLLATARLRNHKLTEAEEGFQQALAICLELNNQKGIAEAKAGLAGVYFIRGQYEQSEKFYLQAISDYPPHASSCAWRYFYSDLGPGIRAHEKMG